jgi:hypothetical protein
MFQTKFVEKIKIRIFVQHFFQKSSHLWHNVEKYSGVRGVTNDVTTWRIRVACWISKATCTYARTRTHTHKYVIIIAFTQQQWFENAPEYDMRTLCVLFKIVGKLNRFKSHDKGSKKKMRQGSNHFFRQKLQHDTEDTIAARLRNH